MSDNPLSKGNVGSIVERAKAIIMNPKDEWPKIAAQSESQNDVLFKYALPLIALGPICGLIGSQLFGYGGMGYHFRPSLGYSISAALVSFVAGVVSLFIVTYIANFLAPKFGGKQDWLSAFRLVAYSMTAGWLAGIFSIVPMLGILAILGLYSIYLFYLGCAKMLGVNEDQAGGYTAVTIIVAIVVNVVLGMLAVSLTGGPGPML